MVKHFRTDVPLSLQNKPSKAWRIFDVFSLDVTKLFDHKRGPALPRTVYFGLPLSIKAWKPTKKGAKDLAAGVPEDQVERYVHKKTAPGYTYPSNQVITSKYNLITFLPRNLLEQFRRVANIFFLILVILQFFPRFSSVSPALAALPLLVVLGVTAIKDGYEDLKRHQSDRAMNSLPVRVLHADDFHNPNVTESKDRVISLRTFGLGFLTASHPDKASREENAVLEGQQGALAPQRRKSARHWWGAKKIKKPSVSVPGGGELGHIQEEAKEKKKPAFVTRQTEYDELPENEENPSYGGRDGRPRWKDVSWEDLKVGDYVKLENNEAVPADIIICSTSEDENVAYVETKNLDGETNLKSRHAVPELAHLRTAQACTEAKFYVESDAPSVDMFRYSAAVTFQDGQLDKDGREALRVPVTLNTVLLRGTVLRNTDWAIGIVMASGIDTKIILNSGRTPSKRSHIERQMNPMVFFNLFLLALMCVMCAVGDAILEHRYYRENAYWAVFATLRDDNPRINGIITFANAMITFQNIVPISLYISIEFVKLLQAFFIWADDEMVYGVSGRRTMARSWNLSDDLGQIQYIFSDKTGTLTQNVMQFRHCTIGGTVYHGDGKIPEHTVTEKAHQSDHSSDSWSANQDNSSKADGLPNVRLPEEVLAPFHDAEIDAALTDYETPQARLIFGFFVNLALCHTVLAADDGEGNIQYKAQSPDEAALVQAAADVGFVFLGRDRNLLKIQTPADPEPVEYELLNVIEFSSARKRMSVIIKKADDPDNSIFVLMKGADNVIFERLAPGQDDIKLKTDEQLDQFANEGLRTLTLAYREMDYATYLDWEREYQAASTAIEARDEAMEAVADKIERSATLLGATAIEDKLQEGVPECLADLKRAGIKVWVCTGDKLETAVAIGMSSNLLTHDMNLIIVRGGAITESRSAYSQLRAALIDFFDAEQLVLQVEKLHLQDEDRDEEGALGRRPRRSMGGLSAPTDIVGEDNGQRTGGFGLVIDGTALRHAFAEPLSKDLLLELSTRCSVVVCCRTSPLQKAQVVHLVKDGLGAMCLGIGDGANDVSMIQAADVGVGVAGEEGLQAVNSSDYSIAQFRFLKRLLLVHGIWDYMRNGNMIVNFFYKEIIGIGVLFFFQFYCAFSTTTVYEYTFLLFWNVFWTLLPVIAIGVMDRAIEQGVLMHVPELYRHGREQHFFSMTRFLWYMVDGIYQSAVCYFFVYYSYNTTTTRQDGYQPGLYEFSTLMAIAAVYAANLYNGLNTHSWTIWVWISVGLGPLLIFVYSVIYSAIKPGWIWTLVFGNNIYLLASPIYWFAWVFCIILSLIPRYIVRYYKELYTPSDFDILKIVGKFDPDHDYYHDPNIPGGYQADQAAKAAAQRKSGRAQEQPRLARVQTDMSGLEPVSSRGFNFDQADGVGEVAVGRPLRTYTSRSLHSQENIPRVTRPRSGSVRRVAEALGFPKKSASGSVKRRPSRMFKSGKPSKLNQEIVDEDSPLSTGSPSRSGSRSQPTSPESANRYRSASRSQPTTQPNSPLNPFEV